MRCSPLLLVLAAALLLPGVAEAKPKRCGKQAVTIGPKKRPKACVPTTVHRQDPKAGAKLARLPRKAKRDRKAERLARELTTALKGRLDAGQPALAKARALTGVRARTAGWADGEPESVVTRGDATTATFRHDGYEIKATETPGFVESTASRGKAEMTLGLGEDHVVPSCPTATGDVPAKYHEKTTYGVGGTVHGKRHFFHITQEYEGTWKGHVGLGAKAETFDLDMRGTLEIRGGVEIAATGKLLKREPTRTYRAALTKQRVPVGADIRSVIRDLRLRGPKGARVTSKVEADTLGLVGAFTALTVTKITEKLRKGDERWHDARACAKADHASAPAKVRKGGQADWDVTVLAQDGTPAADAIWTASSSCGALTTSATRGPKVHFTVTDTAASWSYDPSRPACAAAEITSPAGRAAFDHSIEAEDDPRYAFDATILYRADMGQGVTPTNMDGTGHDVARVGEEEAEAGTGSYTGSEWDNTVHNTCGMNMSTIRGFSGAATFGADIQDDGTVTVGWTANERPFTLGFVATVPLAEGTHVVSKQGTNPFCGVADGAKWEAVIGITVTKLR